MVTMCSLRSALCNESILFVHQSRTFGKLAYSPRVPDCVITENTDFRATLDDHWDTVVRNKKSIGLDQRVFADLKTRKFRQQIYNCSSVDQITAVLHSPTIKQEDRTCSVFTAAIRRSGELGDFQNCIDFMNTALNDPVIEPDVFLYNQLFKSLNLCHCPLKGDPFLQRMLTVDEIPLNITTIAVLLNGCRGVGHVDRARKIWKMMEEHNLDPDISCFINMIKTLGQNGDINDAKRYYNAALDQINASNDSVPAAVHGVMFHALLKNNKIEEALTMKDKIGDFNQTQYTPLIAYYLRDDTLDPHRALQLLKECILKTGMTKLDRFMSNLKYVALFRCLEKERDSTKRDKYWSLIQDMPRQRAKDGLKEWDYNSSKLYFSALLEYYGQRDDHPVVIERFEYLVNIGMLGYWTRGREENAKPLLDFHGYGREHTRFMVHYLMNIKWKEIMEKVGTHWVVVTGNRYHATPAELASRKSGIKEYIMEILKEEYQIESKEKKGNRGRIILNRKDLKRFLNAKMKENEGEMIEIEKSLQTQSESEQKPEERQSVISTDSLESKTCIELKQLLRECSLKVSGRKDELIERLRQYHRTELGD